MRQKGWVRLRVEEEYSESLEVFEDLLLVRFRGLVACCIQKIFCHSVENVIRQTLVNMQTDKIKD